MGMEEVFSATALSAERLIRSIRWEDDVPVILQHLGQAVGAHRASLFQNHRADDGRELASERLRWPPVAPGSGDAPPLLVDVSRDGGILDAWTKGLAEAEVLSHTAGALSPGERAALGDRGVQSVLLSAISVSGNWWGFLAFEDDTRERSWSSVEMDAVAATARLIGETVERQSFEQELRDSEERYRILVEKAPAAIAVQREGTILFVNQAAAEMLGAERPQQIIGRSSVDFVHPDAKDAVRRRLEDLQDGAAVPTEEFNFVRFDGTPIIVQLFSRRTVFNGLPAVETILADVTERRKAEQLVRDNEQRQELALAGSGIGLWDWNVQADKVLFDDELKQILGYAQDEVESSYEGWLPLVHPDDVERALGRLNDHVEGRVDPFEVELRMRTRAGEWQWVVIRGRASERDADGAARRIVGTYRDISKRKKAEQDLRVSEERFRAQYRNAPMPTYTWQYVGGHFALVDYNDAAARVTQGKIADLKGRTTDELYPDRPRYAETMRRCFEEQRTIREEMVYRLVSTDVERITVVTYAYVPPDLVMIHADDITDRKQAEQALKESEKKYRVLVESANEVIMTLNRDGRFLFVNGLAATHLRAPPEELIGKSVYDILPREEADRRMKGIRHVVDSGQPMKTEVRSALTSPPLWFSVSMQPVLDPSGETIALLIATDITDRKLAEQALRESEEKYRVLVEGANESIFTLDRDGRHLFFNSVAAAQVGVTPEACAGKTLFDIFPADEAKQRLKAVRAVIDGRKAIRAETPVTLMGEHRWYNVSLQPLQTHTGEVVALGIASDITGIKAAETELERYTHRLATLHDLDRAILAREPVEAIVARALACVRKLVPSVGAGMVAFTADGRQGLAMGADSDGGPAIAAVAQAPPDLFGSYEHLQRGHIHFVRDFSRLIAPPDAIKSLSYQGVTGYINVPVIAGDELIGSLNVLTNNSSAIGDAHLDIIRELADTLAVAVRNARLDEQVQRHAAELEQRVKDRTGELEAFSYSLSHDLQTPLRAIDGFSSMLLKDYGDRLDDEGRQRIEIIQSSIAGMRQLIEDLLGFYRLSRRPMQRDMIDMTALVRRTIEEQLAATPEARERLTVHLDDLPPAYGDPGMIHQVLQNLLSNAIKFSTPRDRPVIRISAREKGRHCVYSFEDNGVGFDMKKAHRLFTVFERLHSAAEFSGTGAGLAVVKRIVERHGGRVGAEGSVDEGARFFFSLEAAGPGPGETGTDHALLPA